MKMRIISLLVSFGLLGVLIYISGIKEVVSILRNVNLFYVFIGIILSFFDAILRTFRWGYLLKQVDLNLQFYKILKIFIPSQFLSNLSPGKIGEPIRNILLKKVEGKSIGISFPSIFYERVFDVLIMSTLSIVGIFLFASAVNSLWLLASMSVYFFIFGIGIFILFSRTRTQKFSLKLFSALSFIKKIKKYKKRMIKFSTSLHESFIKYNNKKTLLRMLVYTTLIWCLNGALLFIAFKTLGIEVSLISTITIVPIASLIGILTFLPGGIGSSEAIIAFFFISLFSLTLAQVMAAALLLRTYYFLIYGVLSAIILPSFKYKYKI